MSYYHKSLNADKWKGYDEAYQILSIGAELGRAKNAIDRNDLKDASICYLRALELIDLTISDFKWKRKLRELIRLKEYLSETLLFHLDDLPRCLSIYKVLLSFHPKTVSVLA